MSEQSTLQNAVSTDSADLQPANPGAPSLSTTRPGTNSQATPAHPTRYAVIGDVGGHHASLVEELRHLGADPDAGVLPPDLVVVQVGDLVHRGPASDLVVSTVDRFLQNSPGRWLQLVGNHEAQYLRRPVFDWPERIAPESADTLRRWWHDGLMVAAAVVPGDGPGSDPDDLDAHDWLVTHAGLTREFWRRDLSQPRTAEDAASGLNAMARADDAVLFRPGRMLTGHIDRRAGPVWAEAGSELVDSWLGNDDLPFNQVHGHSTCYDWSARAWRAAEPVVERTTIDRSTSHETTWLRSGCVVGVDPAHGVEPRAAWAAWQPPRQRHA